MSKFEFAFERAEGVGRVLFNELPSLAPLLVRSSAQTSKPVRSASPAAQRGLHSDLAAKLGPINRAQLLNPNGTPGMTIDEFKERAKLSELGDQLLRVKQIDDCTDGWPVPKKLLGNRTVGKIGTIEGYVGEGDLHWVVHTDGSIAPYRTSKELEPAIIKSSLAKENSLGQIKLTKEIPDLKVNDLVRAGRTAKDSPVLGLKDQKNFEATVEYLKGEYRVSDIDGCIVLLTKLSNCKNSELAKIKLLRKFFKGPMFYRLEPFTVKPGDLLFAPIDGKADSGDWQYRANMRGQEWQVSSIESNGIILTHDDGRAILVPSNYMSTRTFLPKE